MADRFLKTVYHLGQFDSRDFYAKWSKTYDSEVSSNGYVTPQRCAKALAQFSSDLNTPVLDYGCGTGLSGQALFAEGFTTIHGYDISKEMLALANAKSIYSVLKCFDPGKVPEIAAGMFHAIAAIGVISVGAAPPSTFDLIFDLLAPKGLFVFSFNDHALADPSFEAKVKEYTDSSRVEILFEEYGDHLPGAGLKSNVYVLKKA